MFLLVWYVPLVPEEYPPQVYYRRPHEITELTTDPWQATGAVYSTLDHPTSPEYTTTGYKHDTD